GFFAAGLGVLAVSVIRDRFSGDKMARLMSLILIIFMLVPVIAPSVGQLVLLVAGWREIFYVLALAAIAVFIWAWHRLPETLPPEYRQAVSAPVIARNWLAVVKDRQGLGYMMS